MLYVTTRNNRDAYTAQRVLRENRGPDGGLYVPFREPVFSREEIDALKEKSFHQCVAEVLNRLFNTKLIRWDVEFCVGRYPVRLVNLPQRIIAGEWRGRRLRVLTRGFADGLGKLGRQCGFQHQHGHTGPEV